LEEDDIIGIHLRIKELRNGMAFFSSQLTVAESREGLKTRVEHNEHCLKHELEARAGGG
jgi:hypothetical protein